GLALLPLADLYLYLAFFPLLAQSPEKNTVTLHQKPVNRPYHSEASLLRGNRTKNFYVEIFSVDNDE
ncbi:hypothetical protein FYD92_23175, partial [Salmonella enterica]|nr:hypothetical protein [Salmonella enterica]